MNGYFFLLPFVFLQFWFIEAPYKLVRYFSSLNEAFVQLVSLSLFIRTFFQPLKNEYRQGLVPFSIGMGIAVKSVLILVDLFLLICLLFAEGIIFVSFLSWPILTVYLLFGNSI